MKKDNNTMDMFEFETALDTARKEIMAKAREDGGECPCCGQFVKVYRRTITSTMARQLLTAYHKHGAKVWFHTRTVVLADASGAGDFSKLEYWGLIERQAHVQGEDGKRSSGMWRITSIGREWALNRTMVPMYTLVYNDQVLGQEGSLIDVHHALGKKFDYREIMGWTGGQDLHRAAQRA